MYSLIAKVAGNDTVYKNSIYKKVYTTEAFNAMYLMYFI